MRIGLMALFALLALPTAGWAQARDNYPVCLRVYGPANYDECRYSSIPQCQMIASGRAAQCLVNPYFAAPEPAPRRARRR